MKNTDFRLSTNSFKTEKISSGFTRHTRNKKSSSNGSSCSLHLCRNVFPSTCFQLNSGLWTAGSAYSLLASGISISSRYGCLLFPWSAGSSPDCAVTCRPHWRTGDALLSSESHGHLQDEVACPSQGCVQACCSKRTHCSTLAVKPLLQVGA